MYTHLLSWRISSNESEETFRLSWLRSQNSGILYLPPFQYERRKKLTGRLASNWRFHSTAKDVSLSLSLFLNISNPNFCVCWRDPSTSRKLFHAFSTNETSDANGPNFFLKCDHFFFFTHQQWKERECWCLWKVNWKIENGKMRKIWMRPLPFKTWVIYVLLYFSFGQHSCCLFVPVWWETWKKRRRKKKKKSSFFCVSSETPGIRWKYHRRKKLAIRGYRSSRHFNSGVKRTRTHAAKENGWNKNSCVANGSRK